MISVERIAPTDPDALALLGGMEAELTAIYGAESFGETPTAHPEELAAYVIVRDGGRAVAGGGLKPLAPSVLEIKRMYVVPGSRSRGHGRRLLEGLEAAATELGAARVRLDTGREQPHARALYESAGYRAVEPYNINPYASYWGEKDLPGVIPARFNGPPASGHGGYSSWVAARYLDGPVDVSLHKPPPLETPLEVTREADAVRLLDGAGEPVLSARPWTPDVEPPEPLDVEAAHASREPSLWAADAHPFPTCFACGPLHPHGLHLYPGAVGDGRFATDWTPPAGCDASLVWSALDCPSWAPFMAAEREGACVLARFGVTIASLPPAQPHAIVSVAQQVDGRKRTSISALFGAGGELRALGRALWIELR